MFGDADWVPDRTQRQLRAHTSWRRELHAARVPLTVIEIGAGTAIPTVRREAELAGAASGALVRINLREPGIRHGRGVGLACSAATGLTALAARVGA
jgi:hypothetical protein